MDSKLLKINQMMDLIMESSHPMPDYVFHYYVNFNKQPEEKIFYNLIADSFLTVFSFCKLMRENAWSQAFTLLRMGIEQVSAVFIISNKSEALEEYINLHKLKVAYINIEDESDQKSFLSKNNIPRNRINDYFDYGWVAKFTSDGKYGRNQMIKLAHLDEFLVDIEQSLNAFSHGSMSVFQMSKDNWDVMKRYGRRACLTCCKLYDFLCCSYHNLIGNDEFTKLPLNKYFVFFKTIYHELFAEEGWIKND